jgi:hypothetical protein
MLWQGQAYTWFLHLVARLHEKNRIWCSNKRLVVFMASVLCFRQDSVHREIVCLSDIWYSRHSGRTLQSDLCTDRICSFIDQSLSTGDIRSLSMRIINCLFWLCALIISWLYLDYVLIMSWLCLDYVLIMSWLCLDYVLIMSWLCLDDILLMSWLGSASVQSMVPYTICTILCWYFCNRNILTPHLIGNWLSVTRLWLQAGLGIMATIPQY